MRSPDREHVCVNRLPACKIHVSDTNALHPIQGQCSALLHVGCGLVWVTLRAPLPPKRFGVGLERNEVPELLHLTYPLDLADLLHLGLR